MSSPSLSTKLPFISKEFHSASYIPNASSKKGAIDGNYSFPSGSNLRQRIGASNTAYPLIPTVEQLTVTNNYNFSGNVMTPTANFNVIKVDLNTKDCTDPVKLNLHYGVSRELGDSSIKYSTVIAPNTNFYRNYPVSNDFFSVSMQNESTTSNALVEGNITLSKYTQFNPPIQTQDLADRFVMNNASRINNSFEDDITLSNRVKDVVRESAMGITNSVGVLKKLNWSLDDNFDFLNKTATTVNLISDSASDNGTFFVIRGQLADGTRITEGLISNGTSNVTSSNSYTCIDAIDPFFIPGNNVGNIRVNRSTDGTPMCYSQAESGRSTTLSFINDSKAYSIVKTLSLVGHIGLNHETKFRLYKTTVDAINERKVLVFETNIKNGPINEEFKIDQLLIKSDRLYGELVSSSATSLGDDTRLVSNLDIVTYYLFDENKVLS
jgi:hypothetical protein